MQISFNLQTLPLNMRANPQPSWVKNINNPSSQYPFGKVSSLIAAPTYPAALENAVDSVASLFDFPGIKAGNVFNIVKGSKVGFLGVKGNASITKFDDAEAEFQVKAGAFGMKVDVTVNVTQTSPDTVRLTSHGSGIPDQVIDGRIVVNRTNYAEFARIDDPTQKTIFSRDINGRITVDMQVPTLGKAHLLLDPAK